MVAVVTQGLSGGREGGVMEHFCGRIMVSFWPYEL